MKILTRTLVASVVSLSLITATSGSVYALDSLPGSEVATAVEIDTSQPDDDASDEIEPAALGALVAAIAAAIAGGYQWGYNDGVARAASGEVTWSMFNSPWTWALVGAANALGPVGIAGYQGWSHGFKTECPKHSYCIKR
ncbi:hypothetical protein [Schaalia hyovaginalis]|uniref:hypothetical protein n=1 Tax=Schaalia hyovaginalis TaxID=29316 RepID=UPI0026EC0709|nr:hypothetical protein [Schaalia hyovaginalis]MCI6556637.1 hypothetical protein [Schaalia hyovaginalis]MDD7553234.1 hypothetical protein [Schaalia hyovaginalis]MDY3093889.1 hypothetical protein [Schaalia hyovaginalis]